MLAWTSNRAARHSVTAIAALSCVLVAGLAVHSAARAGIEPDDLARLRSGEAIVQVSEVEGPADGAIFAAIDVPASPSKTWGVLYDCAGAPLFMENLKSCTVLEADGGGAWDIRQHIVSWTNFLPNVRSVFRSDYDTNKSIRFQRVEGDLSHLEGEWRLQPLDGGRATRITYSAKVGFHALVPGFMVRSALETDIPQFLRTIRAEVMRRG